jgi:hypothetical protein
MIVVFTFTHKINETTKLKIRCPCVFLAIFASLLKKQRWHGNTQTRLNTMEKLGLSHAKQFKDKLHKHIVEVGTENRSQNCVWDRTRFCDVCKKCSKQQYTETEYQTTLKQVISETQS